MHWSPATVANLTKCFRKEQYKTWSEAVEEGGINKFSDELNSLIERLSGMLVTELEISPDEHEKIEKMMELAAVAGKVL